MPVSKDQKEVAEAYRTFGTTEDRGRLGKEQRAVLPALKQHFNPNNIMNPGGTLGLEQ